MDTNLGFQDNCLSSQTSSNELHEITTVLENDLSKLLEWFTCNGMVVNHMKFQLMFLGVSCSKQGMRLRIQGSKVLAKKHVELLGTEIDNKLGSDKHVQTLRQKITKNCWCFSRLKMYNYREQALSICNVVTLSFHACIKDPPQ